MTASPSLEVGMMSLRNTYCCLLILFFTFSLTAEESSVDLYRQYKSEILSYGVYCVSQTIFSVGSAKIISNLSIASTSAQMDAQSKILTYLQKQIKVSEKPASISAQVAKMLLNMWLNRSRKQYSLRNIHQIETKQKDGKIYVVLAVKLQDIVNPYPAEITWPQLVKEYTALPKKNGLLLYEIYDQTELVSRQLEIELNIAGIYGKNFSLVFFCKNAVPEDSANAKEQKLLLPSLTAKTPLPILIRAINLLAYNPAVIKLTAEKFEVMGMPRSAEQMKKALVISKNLEVQKEKAAADAASAQSVERQKVPEAKAVIEDAAAHVTTAEKKKESSEDLDLLKFL